MSDDPQDVRGMAQSEKPGFDKPETGLENGHTAQFVNWTAWSICAIVVVGGLVFALTTDYPVSAIGGIMSLLALGWGVYDYCATICDSYSLSSQRLITRKGVFHRRTDTLELYRVKDAVVDEPFIYRMVGIGNVRILTSDESTPVVKLSAIAKPHEVADLVREYTEKARNAKRVRLVE